MNSKLIIFVIGFIIIVNIFCCDGNSHKLTLPGSRLLPKRTFSSERPFEKPLEKRFSDQVENVEEDYDYYFHGMEEPQCSDGQFWHVRGFRCVPFECPGGNQFRDGHTGECTLKTYGVSRGNFEGRPSRFLNSRMKASAKFRLPFGLTLKG